MTQLTANLPQPEYELAQLNIAQLLDPIDSPRLQGFVDNLDRINHLAERSTGFRWRLQTPEGDATSIRDLGEHTIVNLSVWTNLFALKTFVYKSAHLDILKQKQHWFAPMKTAHQVLWWVPVGHRPDTAEARQKLTLLEQQGPNTSAFTFTKPFPPPSGETYLHLICGLPGAGKTTLAKQLSASLPAIRYCPDEWVTRVQSNLVDNGKIRDTIEALQWQEAQRHLADNHCVILENGFWTREDRARYLKQANDGGIRVKLHFLEVPLAELKVRLQRRNENLPAATFPVSETELEKWAGVFEAPTQEELQSFQAFEVYRS